MLSALVGFAGVAGQERLELAQAAQPLGARRWRRSHSAQLRQLPDGGGVQCSRSRRSAHPDLIKTRKVLKGVEPKPEPERLEAAEAVLGDGPVLLGDRMEIGSHAGYLGHWIRTAQGVAQAAVPGALRGAAGGGSDLSKSLPR